MGTKSEYVVAAARGTALMRRCANASRPGWRGRLTAAASAVATSERPQKKITSAESNAPKTAAVRPVPIDADAMGTPSSTCVMPKKARFATVNATMVEPAPAVRVSTDELDGLCLALAIFADLKGTYLLGHSPHVARLAGAAGARACRNRPEGH